MSIRQRCPGSGTTQTLAWFPDESGYPGAVVCISCSLGIRVLKGSVFQDAEGYFYGRLRVHSKPDREPEPRGRQWVRR